MRLASVTAYHTGRPATKEEWVEHNNYVTELETTMDEAQEIAAGMATQKVSSTVGTATNPAVEALQEQQVATASEMAEMSKSMAALNADLQAVSHGGPTQNNAGKGGKVKNYCPQCKRKVEHTPNDCFKLKKNKGKRTTWYKFGPGCEQGLCSSQI